MLIMSWYCFPMEQIYTTGSVEPTKASAMGNTEQYHVMAPRNHNIPGMARGSDQIKKFTCYHNTILLCFEISHPVTM